MLTGKPPFQSTTADEIYRRAREREYDWPKLDTSENFISEETKDLVSILLQSPEKRPDPDTIVQHPFFTCGWMPQVFFSGTVYEGAGYEAKFKIVNQRVLYYTYMNRNSGCVI